MISIILATTVVGVSGVIGVLSGVMDDVGYKIYRSTIIVFIFIFLSKKAYHFHLLFCILWYSDISEVLKIKKHYPD